MWITYRRHAKRRVDTRQCDRPKLLNASDHQGMSHLSTLRRILAFTITTDKSSTRLNASTSNIPPRVHAINQSDTRIASRRAFVTPAHADNEERVFASTFVFCWITQLLAVLSLLFLANPSLDLIVTKYNANVSIANISLDAEQLTPVLLNAFLS